MGWNPDGGTFEFEIAESDFDTSYVYEGKAKELYSDFHVQQPQNGLQAFTIQSGNFFGTAAQDGSELHYIMTNLPAHVS